MDSEPGRVVDEDYLRKRFLEKDFLDHKRFLASVEEPANKVTVIRLKTADGTEVGTVRVRKWKHGEIAVRQNLPFYHKFVFNKPLTEEEQRQYEAFQAEAVSLAVLEPKAWEQLLAKHPQLLQTVYGVCCSISGFTQDFVDKLEAFTASDYGFSYGLMWMTIFGKTPSEVADLPETDVVLVESLLPKVLERMKPRG